MAGRRCSLSWAELRVRAETPGPPVLGKGNVWHIFSRQRAAQIPNADLGFLFLRVQKRECSLPTNSAAESLTCACQ